MPASFLSGWLQGISTQEVISLSARFPFAKCCVPYTPTQHYASRNSDLFVYYFRFGRAEYHFCYYKNSG